MRWEDERYVRVYTRDNADWLALGWEAQAVLLLALRKADRAGFIDTGKAGVRGLSAMTGVPLDVTQRALELLLADGCLVQAATGYVFKNYIDANETKASDAARQRASRERDRDKKMSRIVTGQVEQSRFVTVDQGLGHAGDVTPECHAGDVTPCRAVPSLAVPSRTKPKSEEIPTLVTAEAEPALFPTEVIPPTGPNARSVFDKFQDIRSKHLPKTKRQVFSPDRQRKIEQALASHGHDDVVAALEGYFLDPFHKSIAFGKADVEFILRNARHIEQFRDHHLRHARVSAKPAHAVAAKAQPTAEEQAEVMAKLEGWAREAGAASFEEYASGAMAAVSSRLQGSDDADPFDLAFDVFMGQPGAAT